MGTCYTLWFLAESVANADQRVTESLVTLLCKTVLPMKYFLGASYLSKESCSSTSETQKTFAMARNYKILLHLLNLFHFFLIYCKYNSLNSDIF